MAGELLFTIGTPGFQLPQIQRTLGRLSAGVKDLSPAFADIADDYVAVEKGQFDSLGAEQSGEWAPLSAAYAAEKAKKFPGQPLLVRSGRMRAALIGKTPDTVRDILPLELRMGIEDATVPYAKFHQTGTLESFEQREFSGSGMPRRPVLEFGEKVRRRWVRIISAYLRGLAKPGTSTEAIGRRA